jgi:hypothetical protein
VLYRYFLFISMALYGIGFTWLILIGEYNLIDPGVNKHLFAYISFVSGLLLGGAILIPFKQKDTQYGSAGFVTTNTIALGHKVTNLVGIISCIFSAYYVIDGGYEKILLLGSNIDALDFRFMGLNDRSGWIAIPMELSRRILLPFAILAKLSLNRFTANPSKSMLLFFVAVFMSVSVINLDRGPILMFIVLLAYQFFSVSKSTMVRLGLLVATVAAVGFTGAVFTFLQYNNLNFQFRDIMATISLLIESCLAPLKCLKFGCSTDGRSLLIRFTWSIPVWEFCGAAIM